VEDFDSFSDFLEGLSRRRDAKLPDSILLIGKTAEGKYLPFGLDEDYRLLLDNAPPKYYGLNPVLVQTVAGKLLTAPTGSNYVVVDIDVVNVTGAPVALTLWRDNYPKPRDSLIVGICGRMVPANGYWQWRGKMALGVGYCIWGQAGSTNALVAHLSYRENAGSWRIP
jgi:hypothetical protein